MIDHEVHTNPGKFLFDKKNQEKNRGFGWEEPSGDLRLSLSHIFPDIVENLFLILENSIFKNLWQIKCYGGILCTATGYTLLSFSLATTISTNHRVFVSLVGQSETRKRPLIYFWLEERFLKTKRGEKIQQHSLLL